MVDLQAAESGDQEKTDHVKMVTCPKITVLHNQSNDFLSLSPSLFVTNTLVVSVDSFVSSDNHISDNNGQPHRVSIKVQSCDYIDLYTLYYFI